MNTTENPPMIEPVPIPNLAEPQLDLADIEAAGWKVEYNGCSHFFRQHGTGKVEPMPQWATGLINLAFKQGQASVRQSVCEALGIKKP